MAGLPWFKCMPRDFREGMIGLTCEERGAYATLVMLIYERGAPIPDDAAWICAHLTVSRRSWDKLRAALIARKKLFETDVDGVLSLMNGRAKQEIDEQFSLRSKLSSGGKRERKSVEIDIESQKNNELGSAISEPSNSSVTAIGLKIEDREIEDKIKEESPLGPPKGAEGEVVLLDDFTIEVVPAKRPRKQPEFPIPPDWSPTDAERAYAADQGMTREDTDREAINFRDYHLDKQDRRPGWERSWQRWCRNWADHQRERGPRVAPRSRWSGGGGQAPSDMVDVFARKHGLV